MPRKRASIPALTRQQESIIPILMRKGLINVDVLLMQVTPPDKYGKVSTGIAADYTVLDQEPADQRISSFHVIVAAAGFFLIVSASVEFTTLSGGAADVTVTATAEDAAEPVSSTVTMPSSLLLNMTR